MALALAECRVAILRPSNYIFGRFAKGDANLINGFGEIGRGFDGLADFINSAAYERTNRARGKLPDTLRDARGQVVDKAIGLEARGFVPGIGRVLGNNFNKGFA